ncbi:MAG: 50S ribosomal protein L24 [Thermoleophilia bacterium]|jgi:large subunit ribosomal protein L24|nr:50S ribosomal protein L24 [Thermoleophilia bacterium]
MPARVKKGDEVMVVAGKDKGKTGKVLEVRPKDERVVVEGLNIVKRHTKPRPPNDPGGVIEKPAPIHISNVMPLDPDDKKPCRVRIQVIDGKRVRVSARSGKKLD